jgi:hypothetical protein
MFAADAGGAGVAAFDAAADRFCRGADFDAAALAAIPWLTMLSPEDGERARSNGPAFPRCASRAS